MRHTRSSAETEIRAAVVAWCRRSLPGYRVVHELNTGGAMSARADVAAIGPAHLVLFEIKSERDKLTRLQRQVEAFRAVSHRTVVVAHRRWFQARQHPAGVPNAGYRWLVPCDDLKGLALSSDLWAYPEPAADLDAYSYRWGQERVHRGRRPEPRAWNFLQLLWREELAAEADAHGIGTTSRSTIRQMVGEMCWHMTGQEIARAVCRRLRSRRFAEADPPEPLDNTFDLFRPAVDTTDRQLPL